MGGGANRGRFFGGGGGGGGANRQRYATARLPRQIYELKIFGCKNVS